MTQNLNLNQFISEYFEDLAKDVYVSYYDRAEAGFHINDCARYYDEDILAQFEKYETNFDEWVKEYRWNDKNYK